MPIPIGLGGQRNERLMYSILRYATAMVLVIIWFGAGCQEKTKPALPAPVNPPDALSMEPASSESDPDPQADVLAEPILQVDVSGARSAEGVYFCALFDDEEKLRQRKDPVLAQRFPASEETVKWRIETLPPGEYSIAVFHDANENDVLDRHALGFPTEAYGFSNNARSKFGPPPYDKIRFQLGDEPVEMQIHIQ